MSREQPESALPRLAVNKTEASAILGVSVDFFDAHIAHEVRCIHRGRRRLYPVAELQAWLERESEQVDVGPLLDWAETER